MDEGVPEIVDECHEEARRLLGGGREELEALAAKLGGSALACATPNQDTGRSVARG